MKRCKNCKSKRGDNLCARQSSKDYFTGEEAEFVSREQNRLGHCGYYEFGWLDTWIGVGAASLAGMIIATYIWTCFIN